MTFIIGCAMVATVWASVSSFALLRIARTLEQREAREHRAVCERRWLERTSTGSPS